MAQNLMRTLFSGIHILHIAPPIDYLKSKLPLLLVISVVIIAGMFVLQSNFYDTFELCCWADEVGILDALLVQNHAVSEWEFQNIFAHTSPATNQSDDVALSADSTFIASWIDLMDEEAYSVLFPQAHAQTSNPDAFVTTWDTTGVLISSDLAYSDIRFHIDVESGGQVTIDWGTGGSSKIYNATGSVSNYYFNDEPTVPKNVTVSITGDLERFYFYYTNPFITDDSPSLLLSLDQWGNTQWSDMSNMFRGAENMQYKATDVPDLSSNPSILDMFYQTSVVDGNMSDWDVSSITALAYMFNKSFSFNGNLSSWDVSQVTDMTYMFSETASFNSDLTDWDVSSVTDMNHMFFSATSFNSDLSNWDVSSVTNMHNMFADATSFNSDLSSWNVSSVMYMGGMFYSTPSFNYNLGSWFIALEDTEVDNNATLVTNISSRVGFDTDINNYSITGVDAGDFSIVDGQLVLNSASDYSSKSLYHITITANTTAVNNLDLNVEPFLSTSIRVKSPSETAPTVTSITRHSPSEQITDSDTLQFKTTFSKSVTGVDPDDFELSPDSPENPGSPKHTSTPSLFIPYNVNKTDTITVSDSATASSVSVFMNITHSFISDLKVELVAPDNTVRVLHNRSGGSPANIVQTYTPDFGDVSVNGDWQLRIHDNHNGSEGTLNSWSLMFSNGTDSNPITSVTGSGTEYYVTVASLVSGTYNLDVAQNNNITDSASRPLSSRTTASSDQSYTVVESAAHIPPVITLVGPPTVYVQLGVAYTDAGATCISNDDVDITSRLQTSNPVNTSVVQSYTVTFTCTDTNNNSATPVTRAVNVVDSPPSVTSITRYDPVTQTTDSQTLQFKVLFSEAVTRVNQDDFELSSSSPPNLHSSKLTYTSTPSLFVPYNVNKIDAITVSDSTTASSVSVSMNITHAYIGDLNVELVAPDNTVKTLHNNTGGSSDNIVQTYTPDFGNTSINGKWQLHIHDNYDGDEGTLNSWSLTFSNGTDSNPITSVTGSGTEYYVTVASSQSGTYNLDVAQNNNIIDSTPNPLSSRIPVNSDQSYTVVPPSDNTPPVITLVGSSTVDVLLGTTYTDAGATCLDNGNVDITSRLQTSNPVNTSAVQSYTVTFTCTDTNNNSAAPVTRTVNVVESPPSVTSITRYDPVTQTTDSQTLQFNVTFSKPVTGVDPDDFELSPDSPENPGSPKYTSTPSLFIPYNVNKTDTITVSDSATTSSVSVFMNITHFFISDLKVELVAPDNTVRVLHNRSGGSPANIVQTYTPDFGDVSVNGDWQLRIHDNYNGGEGTLNSWSLTFGNGTDSNPITSVTGSGTEYYVTVASLASGTYNLDVAQNNNITDSASRPLSSRIPTGSDQSYTVIPSSDNIPPVITLVGSSAVDVLLGTTYTDAGATCIDSGNVDITPRLQTSNPVNINAAQSYTVTFTCADAANNSAIPITRTVNVFDPAPTVISITRYVPLAEATDSDTLQFKVTFSEIVTGINQDDFELSPNSPANLNSSIFTYTSTPSLFVPYNVTKIDTIAVSDSATLSSVSVSLNITHAYISDLKVDLIAPDNTVKTLHNHSGASSENIVQTYTPDFGSVSINGNWQLHIHDNYDGDEGTLNSWSIVLGNGTDSNPITSVTGSGTEYYVTVASPQSGTYNLDIAQNNNIVDSANNALSGRTPTGDDQSYIIADTPITISETTTVFSTYNDPSDVLLLFSIDFSVDVDCSTIVDGITVSSGDLTDISNSNSNPDRCYAFVMDHDAAVDFSMSIDAGTISENNSINAYAGLILHTNGTQTVQQQNQ